MEGSGKRKEGEKKGKIEKRNKEGKKRKTGGKEEGNFYCTPTMY